MDLKIVFKDKSEIVVKDFKKVIFHGLNAELETINLDYFDDFQLVDNVVTYKFIGNNKVTALGSNILYLNLE